jgi:hypothetical protein
MSDALNRREFLKVTALAATAAAPAALHADPVLNLPTDPLPPPRATLPQGRIGARTFSRLMLGGNLIGGYAHARDLTYVSHLMKRYNTDAKIAETLELAETHGINAVNSWVRDGAHHFERHWKRGGKMQWIAQARLTGDKGMDQFLQAADLGAVAIHATGDTADALVQRGDLDTLAKTLEVIRARKCLAGIGAHGLGTIVACEKAGLKPDFYLKTFHSHDYYTAPRPDETGDLGRYDNSWCKDPEEVAEVMFNVRVPWIAFKVLAAGAIPPARGFRYAFENGADFILVGMFDWQIEEDTRLTREILASLNRTRSWRS